MYFLQWHIRDRLPKTAGGKILAFLKHKGVLGQPHKPDLQYNMSSYINMQLLLGWIVRSWRGVAVTEVGLQKE